MSFEWQYFFHSFTAVPPVILRLAEPEQRLHTCIEFTVRGYPHPKLRWFYKQMEILQNDYIRTEMDFYQDYLEGCLTFHNPTHINNGNYTLEASNPLGTVTKTVYGHFFMEPGIVDEGEGTDISINTIQCDLYKGLLRHFYHFDIPYTHWSPQEAHFNQLEFLFSLPVVWIRGSAPVGAFSSY